MLPLPSSLSDDSSPHHHSVSTEQIPAWNWQCVSTENNPFSNLVIQRKEVLILKWAFPNCFLQNYQATSFSTQMTLAILRTIGLRLWDLKSNVSGGKYLGNCRCDTLILKSRVRDLGLNLCSPLTLVKLLLFQHQCLDTSVGHVQGSNITVIRAGLIWWLWFKTEIWKLACLDCFGSFKNICKMLLVHHSDFLNEWPSRLLTTFHGKKCHP